MTRSTLVLQSLRYHGRNSLAVLAGVAIAAAVIVGALVVGDSVRHSLRKLALQRLSGIEHALVSPRHFFREELAQELQADLTTADPANAGRVVPGLVLSGSAESREKQSGRTLRRAGQVRIYGVDERFWAVPTGHLGFVAFKPGRSRGDAVINAPLARHLQVPLDAENFPIVLQVEMPAAIPRDALLGDREETVLEIPLMVTHVLAEHSPAAGFSLRPDQQWPMNVFADLRVLQSRLQLGARKPSFREPRGTAARLNALFVAETKPPPALPAARRDFTAAQPVAAATEESRRLSQAFDKHCQLGDLQLQLQANSQGTYVSLTSAQMVLDRNVASQAQQVAGERRLRTSSVNTYLINAARRIAPAQSDHKPLPSEPNAAADKRSMYSIIAGVDPQLFGPTAQAPFGPYQFVGPAPSRPLGAGALFHGGAGEILLNDWIAADLGAELGDRVRLQYNLLDGHGEVREEEREFVVQGILRLRGTLAEDRGLTPTVPGITDAKSLVDWRQPFPMKMQLITRRDEEYWSQFRATPKMFVSLEVAKKLWGTRYGELTSIRFAPPAGQNAAQTVASLSAALHQALPSAEQGLLFRPVQAEALAAAAGTTDFTGLFLGFSMFLIVSAAALIGLLFRLGIERRASDVGLWLALGFSPRWIRSVLFSEAAWLMGAGATCGVAAGVGYAALMIYGLNTWWVGAIGQPFLELSVQGSSLAAGWCGTWVVAWIAMAWGMRQTIRVPVRRLLAGQFALAESSERRVQRGRGSRRLAMGSFCLAAMLLVALVLRWIPRTEAFGGFSWYTLGFFQVGCLLLASSVAWLGVLLDREQRFAVQGSGTGAWLRLGASNAVRNRTRSLLSAGLIACATFLIVAMAVAHRDPTGDRPDRNSGNGGFTLLAESSLPVLPDLNTPAGRQKLNLTGDAPEEQSRLAQIFSQLRQVVAFRVNPGENASCTNLYRPAQPTILGVPDALRTRGGFKFVGASGENPWSVLESSADDGTIPALGDMNTLMYSLKAGPGSVIEILDGANKHAKLKVAGMFDGSIFQGVLLISEANFLKLFPDRVGYQYFLLDVDPAAGDALARALESRIPGFSTERVADRIAAFLAVQNTYLSTFQVLGGLGLLLGTVGLGLVMLRNVLERRAELALFRALGFGAGAVAAIVLWENVLVLLWGLSAGAVAAVLAMLPHLASTGAAVPWMSIAVTLLSVLAAGLLSSGGAIRAALRTPVLATLRGE